MISDYNYINYDEERLRGVLHSAMRRSERQGFNFYIDHDDIDMADRAVLISYMLDPSTGELAPKNIRRFAYYQDYAGRVGTKLGNEYTLSELRKLFKENREIKWRESDLIDWFLDERKEDLESARLHARRNIEREFPEGNSLERRYKLEDRRRAVWKEAVSDSVLEHIENTLELREKDRWHSDIGSSSDTIDVVINDEEAIEYNDDRLLSDGLESNHYDDLDYQSEDFDTSAEEEEEQPQIWYHKESGQTFYSQEDYDWFRYNYVSPDELDDIREQQKQEAIDDFIERIMHLPDEMDIARGDDMKGRYFVDLKPLKKIFKEAIEHMSDTDLDELYDFLHQSDVFLENAWDLMNDGASGYDVNSVTSAALEMAEEFEQALGATHNEEISKMFDIINQYRETTYMGMNFYFGLGTNPSDYTE